MEPRYSKNYIKEFLRILVPDGLLIFQLQSIGNNTKSKKHHWKQLKKPIRKLIPRIILNVYRKLKYGGVMERYGIKREDVVGFLKQNEAKIVDIQVESAGNSVNFRYYVMKK